MRTRSRDCKRPRPLFGGRDCEGSGEDTTECDTELPCPSKFIEIGVVVPFRSRD